MGYQKPNVWLCPRRNPADRVSGPEKLLRAPTRPRYIFAVELFVQSNERHEREREMRAAGRLPPGQSLTLKSPVVHVGSVPTLIPGRGIFACSAW